MTKKEKITTSIRLARDYKNTLQRNADSILKTNFFNRVSIAEKITFLKELASANTHLWEAVYGEYPDTFGKTVSITDSYVEWEDNNAEQDNEN